MSKRVPPPPAGALVLARSAENPQTLSGEADGTFLLRRSPGQTYTVLLAVAGAQILLGEIPADFDEPLLQLAVGESGLAGNVRSEGGPAAGAAVVLLDPNTGRAGAWALTDETGRFDLRWLRPGSYVVTVAGQMLRPLTLGTRSEDLGDLELSAAAGAEGPPARRR
jgi:hypothetical protein